jgi:hypothetical protein
MTELKGDELKCNILKSLEEVLKEQGAQEPQKVYLCPISEQQYSDLMRAPSFWQKVRWFLYDVKDYIQGK